MPARTGCCLYSVRSYVKAGAADAGHTNWTADYWKDSTGSYTPSDTTGTRSPNGGDSLRVAVDDAGDVYVAGPRATSPGGAHWNVVKYDGGSGAEIWKVDISTTGTTGNVWAIIFNPTDGKLWIHGDSNGAGATGVVKLNSDGTVFGSSSGGPYSGLLYDAARGIVENTPLETYGDVAGPTALPHYQAIAGGRLATVGAFGSGGSDVGAQLVLSDWPINVRPPVTYPWNAWAIEGYPRSAWPHGAPLAIDLIDGGAEQLLAVACNPIYFASTADAGALALLDTGIDRGAYWDGVALGGAGTPVTYRWRDNSTPIRPRTQLRFQDTSYLIVGSNNIPTIEAVQVADGVRAWAHYHLQPSGIAISADSVVTVGTRKYKATDVDFVV